MADDSLPAVQSDDAGLSSATTAIDDAVGDVYYSDDLAMNDDDGSATGSVHDGTSSVAATAGSPPKKKKPKKSSRHHDSESSDSKRKRNLPGGALLKTEKDKIEKTISSLLKKREQRDKSNKGKNPASVCGILLDNLIEFYESMDSNFDKKFAKYMS